MDSHDTESRQQHAAVRRETLIRVVLLSVRLRASARELSDLGGVWSSTLQELEVLVTLDQLPGATQMTVGQLQRQLVLTSGALAHRLDKMEAAGRVRRTRTPADGRQMLVQMTPAGVAELRRVTSGQVGDDLAGSLSAIEQRLRRALSGSGEGDPAAGRT
jgi:DNA-binding MarR family transcriptional regulator